MNKINPPNKEDENLGSFYMGRMRPPPEPKRVMPKGLLTIVTLLVFAVILWYAYPQGQEKYSGLDVPVIKADTAVYKFKPEDPGGMAVPHQDSTVFDPMEGKQTTVEKILPTPEEPMDKAEALKTKLETQAPKLNLDMQMTEIAKGTEKVIPKKEDPKKIPMKKPVEKAAAPVEVSKQAPVTPAGRYYVQVGSYRDLQGAKTDWSKLQAKYPQFLKGLTIKTERVDLGRKGVWHRLYGGAMPEGRAREICAVLKTENPGGCIVSKK